MDKLQESVKYYREHLQGKEIGLCAGRKNEAIDLLVDFGLEQFKHLAGLHKLEDMPYIAKDKSRRLIERIEHGEITSDKISRSEYYPQVIERLECINHIKSIITESKYIYKSPKKSFYNIEADYMLSQKDELLKNIHLFLKEDQKGHVVPVSILSCATDKFNNFPCSRWTILAKDKIEQQNKSRQDENTKKENTSKTSQQLGNEDNKSFCAYEEKSDDGIKTEIRMSNKVNAEATQIVDERNKQSQLIEQNKQADKERGKQTEKVDQVGHSGKQNQQNNKKGRGK